MVGKLGLLVLLVGSVACGTDRDRERLERNAGAAPVISPQFELTAPVQGPELSSEIVFNDDPEYPSDAHLASAGGLGGPAFGTDSYLVTYIEQTLHIAGVRFSRTGQLLDPFGLFIATVPGPYDYRAPSYQTPVVHTGMAWLTLWETDWTYPSDLNQIRCARLADDGTALDPDGVLVRDANTEHGPFQLAFDGTRVLAISERGKGFFLRPDCTLDSGLFIAFDGTARTEPSVSFDGTSYVILYTRDIVVDDVGWVELRLQRLTPSGDRVGEPLVVMSEKAPLYGLGTGTISTHAGVTMLAYNARVNGSILVHARSLSPAGELGPPIALSEFVGGMGSPIVAAMNDGFAVYYTPRLARVRSDGQVTYANTSTTAAIALKGLGTDGEGLFVFGETEVAQGFDGNLEPTSPPITLGGPTSAAEEDWPGAASNGHGYLVGWTSGASLYSEHSSDVISEIRAVRVTTTGETLEDSPLLLGTGDSWSRVAIASDGDGYLAVWRKQTWTDTLGSQVRAVRISANGVVDPAPLVVDWPYSFSTNPSVFWDGDAYAIVGDNAVARVAADGTLVTRPAGERLPVGAPHAWDGRLLWTAFNTTLTWVPGQEVLDISGREIESSTPTYHFQLPLKAMGPIVALARRDNELLVGVWRSPNLEIRRVDVVRGTEGDPLFIEADVDGASIDLRSNGATAWLTWTERTRVPEYGTVVKAARITGEGPLDPSEIVLARGALAAFVPGTAIAMRGEQTLFTYARLDPAPTVRAFRVRGRLTAPQGDGGAGGEGGSNGDGDAGQDSGCGGSESAGHGGTAGTGVSGAGGALGGRPHDAGNAGDSGDHGTGEPGGSSQGGAPTSGEPGSSPDGPGCGCRVPGASHRESPRPAWLVALSVGFALFRRRSSKSERSSLAARSMG